VSSKLGYLVSRGGPWWVRWPLRILVLLGVVACGFIPYNFEIGGSCRTVAPLQRGIRAQISAEIIEVHVDEGDWVQPGDPIVTLAVRDEKAAVAIGLAQLDRAKAELDLLRNGSRPEEIVIAEQKAELWRVRLEFAQSELTRLRALDKQNAAGAAEVDDAQKSYDIARNALIAAEENAQRVRAGAREEEIRAAEAEVRRLEAQLAHNQELVSLGHITAPIAGRVVTPNIKERIGQTVKEGDLIAVVHDTSRLRAEVRAHESAAAHIKPGMCVKVRLNGLGGRLVKGSVRSISWTAMEEAGFELDRIRSDEESRLEESLSDARDRYVRVYVDLAPYNEDLIAGMTGNARIVVRSDRLWRALARPTLRFLRVEVWSWLP
jgi:multidrug resistance efflux pump